VVLLLSGIEKRLKNVGLLTGKKALHIHARGGFYSEPPMNQFDFANRYVETILKFMGIIEIHTIICEGHEHLPGQAEDILSTAIVKAKELARTF
jgi:FMN-dependent NADH-azoreductase